MDMRNLYDACTFLDPGQDPAPARAARGGAIPPRGFNLKRVRQRDNQKKWQKEMEKREASRLEKARALAQKYNYPIEDKTPTTRS